MIRLTIFLFATTVLFSSCEKFFSQVVEIDPPEYEKSLVFHQTISDQDSTIRLILSRNFGILEQVDNTPQWYVSGATVEWWQNGQKILTLTPLSADSGYIYVGTFPAKAQPGQEYEIRVSHPDYAAVRAVQKMPIPIASLSEVILDRNAGVDSGGSPQSEIEVSFKDEAGVDNYYEILLSGQFSYLEYLGMDGQGNFLYDTVYFESNVYFDNTFDPNIEKGVGESVLLTDRFFDGETYKFKGRFYAYGGGTTDSIPYKFIIRSVTPEYYYWSKSYYLKDQTDDNPFAEPVSVYNNLENGLGIFGLFSERKFLIQ